MRREGSRVAFLHTRPILTRCRHPVSSAAAFLYPEEEEINYYHRVLVGQPKAPPEMGRTSRYCADCLTAVGAQQQKWLEELLVIVHVAELYYMEPRVGQDFPAPRMNPQRMTSNKSNNALSAV